MHDIAIIAIYILLNKRLLKMRQLDSQYYALLENSLSEWTSAADNEDFDDV